MRPGETAMEAPVVVEERRTRTATRATWLTPRRGTWIVLLATLAVIVLLSVLSMQCHWTELGDGVKCFGP
jgi:hypothetical protein